MPLLTPDKSRFKPLGLLKTGRYSAVTLVLEVESRQPRLARWFGVPPGASEVELLEALARQARALKALSAPNVPRFDKLVEGEGGTWMLFEWLEGSNLRRYFGRESEVPDEWVVWWLHQLLTTLKALHDNSPAFVLGYLEPTDLLSSGDRLLLTDLGLFEDMFPEVGASGLAKNPFLHFVAPEKRTSATATTAGDLFSAAAIAFWLATGHSPHSSSPRSQGLMLEALQRARPHLAPEVCELIAAMLCFYPSQRPDSAQALERLSPCLPSLRGASPPSGADVEEYQFAAEETRRINPPTPIFEEEPEPEATPAAPVAAAPRPLPVWQEAAGDALWTLRGRPWAVLVGLGLVAGVTWLLRVSLQVGATTAPVDGPVHVVSGQVASKVPPGLARFQGEWEPVSAPPAGAPLTVLSSSAELSVGHSSVWVDANSLFSADARAGGEVTISLRRGHLRIHAADGDRVTVSTAGAMLRLDPGTDVTADLDTGQGRASCQAGHATLTQGGQTRELAAGSSGSL